MTDNKKVLAVIKHELYGSITTDQHVIDTKNQLLDELDQELENTVQAIVNDAMEELNRIKEAFDRAADAIVMAQPHVTEYPTNGILTVKLIG